MSWNACFAFLVVAAALAGPLRADEITLKNGQHLEGAIVSEDDRQIILRVNDGTIVLKKHEVSEIRREEWTPAPVPKPAATKRPSGRGPRNAAPARPVSPPQSRAFNPAGRWLYSTPRNPRRDALLKKAPGSRPYPIARSSPAGQRHPTYKNPIRRLPPRSHGSNVPRSRSGGSRPVILGSG